MQRPKSGPKSGPKTKIQSVERTIRNNAGAKELEHPWPASRGKPKSNAPGLRPEVLRPANDVD